MKATFVLISIVLFTVTLFADERPWTTRQDLVELQGGVSSVARELGEAIDAGNLAVVRSLVKKAAEQGEWKLVELVLKFPASFVAMREAARAFGELGGVTAAHKLLEGLDLVNLGFTGGDGDADDRAISQHIFEECLSKVTGVRPVPGATTEQKRAAFAEWIGSNGTRTDMPEPPETSFRDFP